MPEFGASSEVGKLRKVIVHRPGLEMRRLTPTNAAELLFDDVIWSRKARMHHDGFVDLMRTEFGVTVFRVHELLKDVVDDPEGRRYILDRKLIADEVGVGGVREMRGWMEEMDSQTLVSHLIGGVTVSELPKDLRHWVEQAWGATDFVLAPLPNQLFTRDSSAWIYGGVTINPMFWPARRKETIHLAAIYQFHPDFKDGDFEMWWGDPPDADHGNAMLEAHGQKFAKEAIHLGFFVRLPAICIGIVVDSAKVSVALVFNHLRTTCVVIQAHYQSRTRAPGRLREPGQADQGGIRATLQNLHAHLIGVLANKHPKRISVLFTHCGKQFHQPKIVGITLRHVRREIDAIPPIIRAMRRCSP